MKRGLIEHKKEFTVEFGKLLIRHQRETAQKRATGGEIDRRAQKFARYLRAARAHAGLTPPELAAKADIPEPMIYALERGLIGCKRMQIAHLQGLASALDEELEMFSLILDRDLSTPAIFIMKAIFSSGFRACLLLGLMLMALFVLSPSSYRENDQYLATRQEASIGGGTSSIQNTVHAQPIDVNVPQNIDLSIRNEELVRGYSAGDHSFFYNRKSKVPTRLNTTIDPWMVEFRNDVTDQPSVATARLVLYVTMILALLSLLLWLIVKNGHLPSLPRRELRLAAPLLVIVCLLFGANIITADFERIESYIALSPGHTEYQVAQSSPQPFGAPITHNPTPSEFSPRITENIAGMPISSGIYEIPCSQPTDSTTTALSCTLRGRVFEDANGNGTRDSSELGLGGVTIMLSTTPPRTATTDASGNYQFDNVPAGTYTVVESDPAGYVSSTPNSVAVLVLENQTATANFGNQEIGSVSGLIFNDIDGNGTQDLGIRGQPSGFPLENQTATANFGNMEVAFVSGVTWANSTEGPVIRGPQSEIHLEKKTVTANFGDMQSDPISGVTYGNSTQDPGIRGQPSRYPLGTQGVAPSRSSAKSAVLDAILPPYEIDYRALIKQQALLISVIVLIIGFVVSKRSKIILLLKSRKRE